MKGFRFLGVGGNRSARRENLPRRVWNQQTKFTYNHWLAALVKGKCWSTKPTRLATGVVCHPDSEQNRPYKIPWPCRELNREPTAPQARTLPACNTTSRMKRDFLCLDYSLSGLRMVNVKCFAEAQKLTWVKYLMDDNMIVCGNHLNYLFFINSIRMLKFCGNPILLKRFFIL